MIVDEAARVVASAQREFTQIYPKPGWVEHDADEIWSTQASVITESMTRASLKAGDIAAVGITNQRETVVLWDRATGRPVANAIVWQDRRTADLCEQMRGDDLEPLFTSRTGLLLDAYFSGTKIRWLLDHTPGLRERAEAGGICFGTIDTWLAWKLTGGERFVTDPSNASRTLLFNVHTGAWDADLCEAMGVPVAMLPEVVPTSGVLGEVSADIGIKGVPVAGLAGDQQAATMGQLCLTPGTAKNTYGTGCFLLMNTGSTRRESEHRLLSTVAWQMNGETTYALEGGVFVGGAIVQWLRDGLGIIEQSEDVTELAASVPDAGGVTVVPALAGLGAPHWDPHARGLIAGITRGTTSAHIARAALEGIAFQVADLVETMNADAASPMTELRVDGGAAVNDLLMQFQADVLQIPVVRPTNTETTAMGAAFFAGLGVGVWEDSATLASLWAEDRPFEPAISASEAAGRLAAWREAVGRARSH